MTENTIEINIDGKTGTILLAGELQLYKLGRLKKDMLIKRAIKSLDILLGDLI